MAGAENVGSSAALPQGRGKAEMSEPMTLTAQSTLRSDSPTSQSLEGLGLLTCKEDKTV